MTDAYQLILLRHAQAEHADSLADHLRPLALDGRRQATAVGADLRESALVPDAVLVSSAVRTRQTWDLVRSGLEVPAEVATLSEALYEAGVRSLLDLVRAVPGDVRRLLVVGHEPTMSQTAATLADAQTSGSAALARVRTGVPTATYSVLESAQPFGDWIAGAVRLVSVVAPA
ncbi:histidine phosphatase family protein [Cellulomonas sp. NPDC089187]|uniref:SixA phosphatase family protein n=1 Tax=Cellulomonas sp. NPDC089187 TaxID=3154970 RepID=UPI0034177CC5